jgi:hypothetical protein
MAPGIGGTNGGDDCTAKRHALTLRLVAEARAGVRVGAVAGGIDKHGMCIDKPAEALDVLDLHTLVGLQRHVAAGFQHPAARGFELVPVEFRLAWRDAQVLVMQAVANTVGRGAPGLGRDATAPQAFAAGERRIVYQRHLHTVTGEIPGAVFAAGAATDHHHVVVPVAFGNSRAGRAHPALGLFHKFL